MTTEPKWTNGRGGRDFGKSVQGDGQGGLSKMASIASIASILAAISASAWRAISVRDIGRDIERICGIYVVKLCELSVRYIIVILCKLQGTG